MITKKDVRAVIILASLICCALLLGATSPGSLTYCQSTTYITALGSEAKSHWNPSSLNIATGASGSQSVALDYSPTLDSGTFSATLRAEAEFGQFRLYSAFALADYPPAANVSLVQNGNLTWTNAPAGSNAQLNDVVMLSSAQPSVDLAVPFVVRGSFDKSGTPMISGELGLSGDFSFMVRIRRDDYTLYMDSKVFRVSDSEYAPGTYWLLFKDVPTNVPLRIRFYCSASYVLMDTYQFTDSTAPYSQLTDSDIKLTEVYRTEPSYSLNGTGDFLNGILFGWYAASKDGGPVPDLSITSENGFSYSPVPYNACPLFDQSKSVKAGASVPIKLQLCDMYGSNLSSPDLVLTGTQLKRMLDNEVVELHSEGRSNAGSIFRYDPALRGYIYTVSTKGLTPGTYQLSFAVGDEPLEYSVHFDVR